MQSGWPWYAQTWATEGPNPSLNLDLTFAFLLIRARTHSGDPAAKANTSGGSPSLSRISTLASSYSKIASTSRTLPLLQARWRAVCPSLFCASSSEETALLPAPDAAFARKFLHEQQNDQMKKKWSFDTRNWQHTNLTPFRSPSETSRCNWLGLYG